MFFQKHPKEIETILTTAHHRPSVQDLQKVALYAVTKAQKSKESNSGKNALTQAKICKILLAHKIKLTKFKQHVQQTQNLAHLSLWPFVEALELYRKPQALDQKTLQVSHGQTMLRIGQLCQSEAHEAKLFSVLSQEDVTTLSARRHQTLAEKRAYLRVAKKVKYFYEQNKPKNSIFIDDQRQRVSTILTCFKENQTVSAETLKPLCPPENDRLLRKASHFFQRGEEKVAAKFSEYQCDPARQPISVPRKTQLSI